MKDSPEEKLEIAQVGATTLVTPPPEANQKGGGVRLITENGLSGTQKKDKEEIESNRPTNTSFKNSKHLFSGATRSLHTQGNPVLLLAGESGNKSGEKGDTYPTPKKLLAKKVSRCCREHPSRPWCQIASNTILPAKGPSVSGKAKYPTLGGTREVEQVPCQPFQDGVFRETALHCRNSSRHQLPGHLPVTRGGPIRHYKERLSKFIARPASTST